jgi:hypothetical protein
VGLFCARTKSPLHLTTALSPRDFDLPRRGHRAVIVSFLDLLNIPHWEGMIEENFDHDTLTNDKSSQAPFALPISKPCW